ncbi:hypothetical protein IMZ29_17045, partial [Achromobacter sp. GG226]|uniref:hypothetical protein n=1 Tax=Verticiella alkaliphila TaxID=2779529 RepID=UPI001C0BAC31
MKPALPLSRAGSAAWRAAALAAAVLAAACTNTPKDHDDADARAILEQGATGVSTGPAAPPPVLDA